MRLLVAALKADLAVELHAVRHTDLRELPSKKRPLSGITGNLGLSCSSDATKNVSVGAHRSSMILNVPNSVTMVVKRTPPPLHDSWYLPYARAYAPEMLRFWWYR